MTNETTVQPDFSQVLAPAVGDAPKQMLWIDRSGPRPRIHINSSSLGIIQTCPRKTYYLLHQGWRSRAGSPPLIFGAAIHKALEVFYCAPREARQDLPPGFDEHAAAMCHGFDAPEKHPLYDAVAAFVKAAEPLQALPDTDKRSRVSGVWVLGHYFRTYANDTYVTFCDEQGPCAERTFSAPLISDSDLEVFLFGTIDLILQNLATGEVLPADHKTSSQMGGDFLNRIKPNHQYTGYLWGAQCALGLQTENFLINGVQVKARPLTARGGPPTFTRQITKRTSEDIDEFVNAVSWACRSYLRWEEANCWPIGTVDACSSWGGCGFLDICGAPNSLRQNILEAKYERQTQ